MRPERLADGWPQAGSQSKADRDEHRPGPGHASPRHQIEQRHRERRQSRSTGDGDDVRRRSRCRIQDTKLDERVGDGSGQHRGHRRVCRAVTPVPGQDECGAIGVLRDGADDVVQGQRATQKQLPRRELRRLRVIAADLAAVRVVGEQEDQDQAEGDEPVRADTLYFIFSNFDFLKIFSKLSATSR